MIVATETSVQAQVEIVEIQGAAVRVDFQLDESVFNQWIFGNRSRNISASDQLDSLLALQITQVSQICSLTDAQKRKLALAGHGDLKRFGDRVARARAVFERCRHDQSQMGEILNETQPLAAAIASGLFGDGSIFAKTLTTTLTTEQFLNYCEVLQTKTQARYKAKVLLALTNLDHTVGLTSEQYRRFAALILAETTPPPKHSGQYEATIVLLKIAKIPESKIRPIFDDLQWKLLNQELQQARGLENFLQANGYLEATVPTQAERTTGQPN